MATRLAVTPFDDRLDVGFREDAARLVGLEDLRDGMNAHAQFWNRLENLGEEAITLFCYRREGNRSSRNSGHGLGQLLEIAITNALTHALRHGSYP